MSLEKLGAQHQEIVDTFHDPAASYQMTTRDYVVRPSASAAITITLPPVSEARGRFYTILARAATRTNTITITSKGDAEHGGDIILYVTGEKVLLYSDGLAWYNLSGGATATIRTTILSADVLLLATTQATLVPAPGAGRVIEFLSATLKLEYGGTNVFTEAADNLTINYTNAAGAVVSDVIECTGFIDQAAHTLTRGVPVKDAIVAYASAANQALVLDNNADNFAGNAGDDNILYVDTTFRVVDYSNL